MKKTLRMSLVGGFAALALVAAACGSGDEPAEAPPAPDVAADGPEVLPPNPNPDETPPPAAGACLEGEPDCQDTGVINDVPTDLPRIPEDPDGASDEPASPGAPMLVDGGLTVSEALATDATGVIAVKGFLVADASGARLCEVLAESYPPQCGGEALPITNYEEVIGVPLQNAQGVTWSDDHLSFLGEIVDGTFVVDPTVAQ